ncbi:MAG: hypothetical protein AAF586_02225 [Planctomycetota bacterium]
MALIGIYGEHTVEHCPLNNPEVARQIVAFAEGDPGELLARHGIERIVSQYHSALEHTFLWVVEAADVHGVQAFCVEGGLAAFNTLRIVPLITFADHVVPEAKRIHGL